jgi:REP element-mobilizing transposase RayT
MILLGGEIRSTPNSDEGRMAAPLYAPDNCRAAFELRWSLSVFWRAAAPSVGNWLDALREATDQDGVRVLEHRFVKANVSQFLLSTAPETAPASMVRSVKGRLQHLVRAQVPKAFRRNYGVRSIGKVRGEIIQGYVRSQTQRHAMADAQVQTRVNALSIAGLGVGLFEPQQNSHAQFCYNLHLVLVNRERGPELRPGILERRRERLVAIAAKKAHRVGNGQILADHLHVTLGWNLGESPRDVAIGYMNNLAYAEEMKSIFEFGFYAGTIGKYDLNAVRRGLADQSRLPLGRAQRRAREDEGEGRRS